MNIMANSPTRCASLPTATVIYRQNKVGPQTKVLSRPFFSFDPPPPACFSFWGDDLSLSLLTKHCIFPLVLLRATHFFIRGHAL
jgi:hypothetical protein